MEAECPEFPDLPRLFPVHHLLVYPMSRVHRTRNKFFDFFVNILKCIFLLLILIVIHCILSTSLGLCPFGILVPRAFQRRVAVIEFFLLILRKLKDLLRGFRI